MAKFILGKKIGMTTVYDEKKGALNVTLVECFSKVSQVRNEEKDGYQAVQVEMPKTKNKIVKKEFKVAATELKKEDEIALDIFKIGERVSVRGITKAKGFQGVVKRHGFGGAPKTHGRKHDHRAPGAIGAGYPEHVIKGKRMAGRMGGVKATSENVEVAYLNKESKLIGLKGAVPGIPGSVVEIFVK